MTLLDESIETIQSRLVPAIGETPRDRVRREVALLVEGRLESQAALARAVGVDASDLSRYLGGGWRWRSPKLARALRKLGVSCCPCGDVHCGGCEEKQDVDP